MKSSFYKQINNAFNYHGIILPNEISTLKRLFTSGTPVYTWIWRLSSWTVLVDTQHPLSWGRCCVTNSVSPVEVMSRGVICIYRVSQAVTQGTHHVKVCHNDNNPLMSSCYSTCVTPWHPSTYCSWSDNLKVHPLQEIGN